MVKKVKVRFLILLILSITQIFFISSMIPRSLSNNNKISIGISNVYWHLNDQTSKYRPNEAHVTFILEVVFFVNSLNPITYFHSDSCRFITNGRVTLLDGTVINSEGVMCLAVITHSTYPPGISFTERKVGFWFNKPILMELPQGIYEFWLGRDNEPINSYHYYLFIGYGGFYGYSDPILKPWENLNQNSFVGVSIVFLLVTLFLGILFITLKKR